MVLGALERKLGRDSSERSHGYLQQRLQYDAASERLMDPEDKAVMMAWEGCASITLALPIVNNGALLALARMFTNFLIL